MNIQSSLISEDSLSEIEKMHNEMKRLYADMAKLEK